MHQLLPFFSQNFLNKDFGYLRIKLVTCESFIVIIVGVRFLFPGHSIILGSDCQSTGIKLLYTDSYDIRRNPGDALPALEENMSC